MARRNRIKTIIVALLFTYGCAHFQGRETVYGVADARWCRRDAATYSFGPGLNDAEQVAFTQGSAAWNAAAASLPAPMVSVTLLERTLCRASGDPAMGDAG